MARHRLTSLEAALSAEPIYSDELEFELHGYAVRIRFRELSQDRIDRLRRSSIQWVEEDRRRKETDEWRDVQMDLDAMRANELDLRMLHASMMDADDPKQPACSLQVLRDRLSPEVQEHLATQYRIFAESLSPDTMSEEDVEALCEAIKKKAMPVLSLSMQYGYKTALVCLDYMASQLGACQTESSSDTSTGESQP